MPASQGTPTIFEKIDAGFDKLVGIKPSSPAEAETMAGVQADLQKAWALIKGVFGPTIQAVDATAFGDVTKFLQGVYSAIPAGGITSIAQDLDIAKGVAGVVGGALPGQIHALESSVLVTLVSAALTAEGHGSLPLAPAP